MALAKKNCRRTAEEFRTNITCTRDVSLNDLPPFMQNPFGIHYIRTKLFSQPLSKLYSLYNSCLENHVTNPNSNEYKITAIVLDIARHRLFKRVGIKKDGIHIRSSLNLSLALIDWCLTSSEQFFSYIQDGNI